MWNFEIEKLKTTSSVLQYMYICSFLQYMYICYWHNTCNTSIFLYTKSSDGLFSCIHSLIGIIFTEGCMKKWWETMSWGFLLTFGTKQTQRTLSVVGMSSVIALMAFVCMCVCIYGTCGWLRRKGAVRGSSLTSSLPPEGISQERMSARERERKRGKGKAIAQSPTSLILCLFWLYFAMFIIIINICMLAFRCSDHWSDDAGGWRCERHADTNSRVPFDWSAHLFPHDRHPQQNRPVA